MASKQSALLSKLDIIGRKTAALLAAVVRQLFVWTLALLGIRSVRKALAYAAVVACVLLGCRVLLNFAKADKQYKVQSATIRLADKPSWMTETIEGELKQPAGLPEHFSIFDPGILQTVADCYRQYPWLKQINRIEKHYPNEIFVDLDLRKPAAQIIVGRERFLSDEQGIRIPTRYYAFEQYASLPEITGVPGNVPEVGQAWPDFYIASALEAMNSIRSLQGMYPVKIRRIDVSNLFGKISPTASDIVLETEFGTRILWGRSSYSAGECDLPAPERLKNLERVLAQDPSLRNVREVTVYWDAPYYLYR